MALSVNKTYTPFQEVSLGYGSNELATNYSTHFPNGTDQVLLEIEFAGGHFTPSGHISTPTSGDATAVFYKTDSGFGSKWSVEGTRDEVDDILSQLVFYPSDYPQSRPYDATDNPTGWRNDIESYKWKTNVTTGVFADENPPTPPGVVFTIKLKDPSNNGTVASENIIIESTPVTIGNQRPYFSSVANIGNLSSGGLLAATGASLDLGIISHGGDSEHVTVTAYAYEYGTFNAATFVTAPNYEDLYIGGKIAADLSGDKIFEFTGTAIEAQLFLDNVRIRCSEWKTFDFWIAVSDGEIGTSTNNTAWFNTTLALAGTMDNIISSEETDIVLANPGYTSFASDNQPEINTWSATIALDAAGQLAITNAYTDSTKTTELDIVAGVITLTGNNETEVASQFDGLVLTPAVDYNGTFSFDITFIASNPIIGSSYSTTVDSVTVLVENVAEYEFDAQPTVTWLEDADKTFDTGLDITDNAYSGTATYQLQAQAMYTTGGVDTTVAEVELLVGTYPNTTSSFAAGVLTVEGPRDSINSALQNLIMHPDTDVYTIANNDNTGFWIEYSITRTTDSVTLLDFTETSVHTQFADGTEIPEFSVQTQSNLDWFEGTTNEFDSGWQVTDTAEPNGVTTHTVIARAMYRSNGVDVAATEVTLGTNEAIGTWANYQLTLQGTTQQLNDAMAVLTLTPAEATVQLTDNDSTGFWIEYNLVRDGDSVVLFDFTETSQYTQFNDGTRYPIATTVLDLPATLRYTDLDYTNINNQWQSLQDLNGDKPSLTETHPTSYRIDFAYSNDTLTVYRKASQVTPGSDIAPFDVSVISVIYNDIDYVDPDYNQTIFSVSGATASELNLELANLHFDEANETQRNGTLSYSVVRNGFEIETGSVEFEYEDLPAFWLEGAGFKSNPYQEHSFASKGITQQTDAYLVYREDLNEDYLEIYNPESEYIVKNTWTDSFESVALDYDNTNTTNAYKLSDVTQDEANNSFAFPTTLESNTANNPVYASSNRHNGIDMAPLWEELTLRIKMQLPGNSELGTTVSDKRFVYKRTEIYGANELDMFWNANSVDFQPGRDLVHYMPEDQYSDEGNVITWQQPVPHNPGFTLHTGNDHTQQVEQKTLFRKSAPGYDHYEFDGWGWSANTNPKFFGERWYVGNDDNTQYGSTRYSSKSYFGFTVATIDNLGIQIFDSTAKTSTPYTPGNDPDYEQGTSSVYPLVNDITYTTPVRTENLFLNSPAVINDLYFDGLNNHLYVLATRFITGSGRRTKLIRYSCIDYQTLDNSAPVELVDLTNVHTWSGSIGVRQDGEIYFVLADRDGSAFRIYHQNTGGSNNWGLSQNITKTQWNTNGDNFVSYFDEDLDSMYCQANTTGWMLLGAYIYRWNGSIWEDKGTLNGADTALTAKSLKYKSALGRNIVCVNNSDYYRLGRHDADADTLYKTNARFSVPDYVCGHKSSNAFITFNDGYNANGNVAIYRFAH